MSISCSVIENISVSHGSGLRRTRSSGLARTARPMTGSSRKRAWKSARSSSIPRRPHPRDPLARGGLGARPRGEHGPGRGDHDRLVADVEQPHDPVPAPPREPAGGHGPRRNGAQRGSRPRARARSPHPLARSVAAQQVDVDQERARRDDLAERARAAALLERLLGPVARDDGDRRGARDEARSRRARRPGQARARPRGALRSRRTRSRRAGRRRPRRPGLLLRLHHPRSTDPTVPGGRAWCRTRDPSTER